MISRRGRQQVQNVGASKATLSFECIFDSTRPRDASDSSTGGEEMLDVLLDASAKLGLGLTREQLANTPPIRDWVWWKNKEAVFTVGDSKPRYQQDGGQGQGEADGQAQLLALHGFPSNIRVGRPVGRLHGRLRPGRRGGTCTLVQVVAGAAPADTRPLCFPGGFRACPS